MSGILITTIFTAIAFFAVWSYYLNPKLGTSKKGGTSHRLFIILTAAAFAIRLILSAVYPGHSADMSCFTAWADSVFNQGISSFYTLDSFHDYPPGYMYVLYLIGAFKSLLNISGGALTVLIKLPAVICDILTGILIYRVASKKLSSNYSAIISSLWLFNPTVILNSSIWGQVDSVFTLILLLMIYFITERKMITSYFMFAICIFIKPQAFILTPILIFGIIENVFMLDFDIKKMLRNLVGGLCAIASIVLLSLPFGLTNVINQYVSTLASYPYHTINAFNLWGALGKNWSPLTAISSLLGYIFIIAITAYSVYIFFNNKNKSKYYIVGAVLVFFTYMLSTKMHERYAFPATALLLLDFTLSPKRKNYIMYALITLSQFFNTAWVLFVYENNPSKYMNSPTIIVAGLINIAILIFMICCTFKKRFAKHTADSEAKTISKGSGTLTRIDFIAMAIIVAIYSVIALHNLGDMHAPETEYMLSDAPVSIDLGDEYEISEYKFFLGSYHLNENRTMTVTFRDSDEATTYTSTLSSGSVFHWEEIDLSEQSRYTARYITLSGKGDAVSVKEFAIFNSDGELIVPASVTPTDGNTLFDEQSEVPERSSFLNGTYFDEIYHARTAYEFINGLDIYEWTHPPLGKVFISFGIKLFGMCPFGWRISGTIFGILMLPLIYIFAKKMFKKTFFAIVTCLLMTFDFMHFAQTRIATIDVYITFFVMLMYFFMYRYYSTSFFKYPFKKGLSLLALCGISMGLGIACKWTGIYAGAGLAVLFFITLYNRYTEYKNAIININGETDGVSNKFIVENFMHYTTKTIAWCIIFFVVVPIVIYGLSYIPFLQAPNSQGIKTIIENQQNMFIYHAKTVLGAEHPFSSRWYEWIIMKRPIWYYSGKISDTVKEGISSFGNPLVWWLGIPAFFYMVYMSFRKKDKTSIFLVIAYLAQLVSWIPVTRLTFIYHYFPCVPFIILMIGYSMLCIYKESKNKKATVYAYCAYTALVIILFAMFYPVLSGQACNVNYVENFLEWFNSWILI